VAVVGELRSSSWEDRNGGKRVSYEVRAENIQFLTPVKPAVQEEVKEIPDLGSDFEAPEPFTFDAADAEEEILGDLEDIPVDDQEEGMAPF
jgi:single-strand DNA-binding protein